MSGQRPRALAGVRLSVLTDETTSPERQMLANQRAADTLGADIVAVAADLDVSATATTPFDRPELGHYLATPDRFDLIIWWRLDRAVRSMADMSALTQWAKKHGKRLVFAEGPGGAMLELDMRSASPTAELIAMMFAFAAQTEAVSIKERVTDAHAALRRAGRWAGGTPPFGFRPAPIPSGGKKLEHDPEALEILARVIRDVMEGSSLSAIADRLEYEECVPSPADWHLRRAGKTRRGKGSGPRRWTHRTLRHILSSPVLLGHRTHQGRTVRDAEGEPVLIGPPVLNRAEWDALQAELAKRTPHRARARRDTSALLLHVARCGSCGGPLYRAKRAGKRAGPVEVADYVCRAQNRNVRCPGPAGVRADILEDYAEEQFLDLLGSARVVRVVEREGYDPEPELRALEEELRALYAEQGTRRSAMGRRVWQERVNALERRAETLEATPAREPTKEFVDTGETYAEYWARQDTEGRRRSLLDAGVRVTVAKGRSGGLPSSLEETRGRFTFDVERDDPEADVIMYDLA